MMVAALHMGMALLIVLCIDTLLMPGASDSLYLLLLFVSSFFSVTYVSVVCSSFLYVSSAQHTI